MTLCDFPITIIVLVSVMCTDRIGKLTSVMYSYVDDRLCISFSGLKPHLATSIEISFSAMYIIGVLNKTEIFYRNVIAEIGLRFYRIIIIMFLLLLDPSLSLIKETTECDTTLCDVTYHMLSPPAPRVS